jgi:hypothetical protein
MARVATETSSVRKGLADRMKPKPRQAQSTGARPAAGGRIDPERFQNPMAARRAKLARGGLDYQKFQNPNAARKAVGTLHPQFAAGAPSTGAAAPATRKVDPTQTTIHGGFKGATATAGTPPQTPGQPGGRFGAWQPRTAQAARPAAAPMQPMPARQPMAPQVAQPAPMPMRQPMVPQMAQAAPMPVPGPYQTPGRPVMPQPMPQMAQPVYPQPQPQVAQPFYPPPQPQMAQPVYPQQYYNPTPYPGRW